MRPGTNDIYWPRTPEDPDGLKHMVSYAVEAFDKGECRGLCFNVFNERELQEVQALMAARPDIPFTWTRIA